jgi:hypothetical protein
LSTRRVHEAPSFAKVTDPTELNRLILEVIKIKPEVEVSIEGGHEIMRGRILEWNRTRELFTISWNHLTDTFNELTASKAGLRNYFKVKLFTTQLVFRAEAIRRMPNGTFHYRFPEDYYQQQKRGALRVPMKNAILISNEGTFGIKDLSVGGAQILFEHGKFRNLHQLHDCRIKIGRKTLELPLFTATLTHRRPGGSGTRFAGLADGSRTEIKQYLIEALRSYYQEKL